MRLPFVHFFLYHLIGLFDINDEWECYLYGFYNTRGPTSECTSPFACFSFVSHGTQPFRARKKCEDRLRIRSEYARSTRIHISTVNTHTHTLAAHINDLDCICSVTKLWCTHVCLSICVLSRCSASHILRCLCAFFYDTQMLAYKQRQNDGTCSWVGAFERSHSYF